MADRSDGQTPAAGDSAPSSRGRQEPETGQSAAESELFARLDDYLDRLHTGDALAESALRTVDPELARLLERLEQLVPPPAAPAGISVEAAGGPFLPTVVVPPAEGREAEGHEEAVESTLPRSSGGEDAGDVSLQSPQSAGPGPDDDSRFFGRFELLAEIGRGGMGVVYRARQRDLDRSVAIKMIRSSHLASADEVRRFYAEARAAARMQHPGVVNVHEVGQQLGQHYFAMDLVEGENLATRIQEQRLPCREAALVMSRVADAVEYLHRHGVIHRDLKPSNILLDEDGCPRITDFGLARIFSGETAGSETRTGTIIGTPGYMAPEQAAGRTQEISPKSDVYSLGAILYELLTGRPPFQRSNPLDTIMEVIESEPPLPRQLDSRIPEQLEQICLGCLEKDPARRYATAAEVAADLERWLRGDAISARGRSWKLRLKRWARREPALVAHWAGLVAAAATVETSFRISGGDVSYHRQVMWRLGAWAVLSLVFQRMLTLGRAAAAARFGWAATDALLLTSILASVEGSIGPLLIGYPLLIVAAGMFFQVRLVVFMTCACQCSYCWLMLRISHPPEPAHYPFIFGSVLAVLGGLVAWQVYRIRTLCHYFEHRRLP